MILKFDILADLGQLPRKLSENVLNWLKEAYLPYLICFSEQKLSLCTLYGVGGMFFTTNLKFSLKNLYIFLHLIFLSYYCSIDLKRQRNSQGFALIRALLFSYCSGFRRKRNIYDWCGFLIQSVYSE